MLKKIRETIELSSEEKEAILKVIYSKRDEKRDFDDFSATEYTESTELFSLCVLCALCGFHFSCILSSLLGHLKQDLIYMTPATSNK